MTPRRSSPARLRRLLRVTPIPGLLGHLVASCCLGPPGGSPTPPWVDTPPQGPEEPPGGSPGPCHGNDRSGVPWATSTLPSTLDARTARETLELWNDLCGDTACEGSFEWYAYLLRGEAGRSEITFRTYSSQEEPVADVTDIEVSGARFAGRGIGQRMGPSCGSPCGGDDEQPRAGPCMVLDVGCAIALPVSTEMAWNQAQVECGIALEEAVRARVPEYFPEPG